MKVEEEHVDYMKQIEDAIVTGNLDLRSYMHPFTMMFKDYKYEGKVGAEREGGIKGGRE